MNIDMNRINEEANKLKTSGGSYGPQVGLILADDAVVIAILIAMGVIGGTLIEKGQEIANALGDGIGWIGDKIGDGINWVGDRVGDVSDSVVEGWNELLGSNSTSGTINPDFYFIGLIPHKLPTTGEPNSVEKQYDDDGNLVCERYYDSDGKAYKDIDYTDHSTPNSHDVL